MFSCICFYTHVTRKYLHIHVLTFLSLSFSHQSPSSEKSIPSFLSPVSAHPQGQHPRETASASDWDSSGGVLGPHGEGLMPTVWRGFLRGRQQAEAGKGSRMSKACWVSGLGWSTVASSGEVKPCTELCSGKESSIPSRPAPTHTSQRGSSSLCCYCLSFVSCLRSPDLFLLCELPVSRGFIRKSKAGFWTLLCCCNWSSVLPALFKRKFKTSLCLATGCPCSQQAAPRSWVMSRALALALPCPASDWGDGRKRIQSLSGLARMQGVEQT